MPGGPKRDALTRIRGVGCLREVRGTQAGDVDEHGARSRFAGEGVHDDAYYTGRPLRLQPPLQHLLICRNAHCHDLQVSGVTSGAVPDQKP